MQSERKAYIVLAPEFQSSVHFEGFCWRNQLATEDFAQACAKRDELRKSGDNAHVVDFWTGIMALGEMVYASAFRALHPLPEVAVTDNPSDYVVHNGRTIDKFAILGMGANGDWYQRECEPESLSEALEMAEAQTADDGMASFVIDDTAEPGAITLAEMLDGTMADIQDGTSNKERFTHYAIDKLAKYPKLFVGSREI